MKSLFTCYTVHVRQRSITRLAFYESRREEAGLNQVIANHAVAARLETLPVTTLSCQPLMGSFLRLVIFSANNRLRHRSQIIDLLSTEIFDIQGIPGPRHIVRCEASTRSCHTLHTLGSTHVGIQYRDTSPMGHGPSSQAGSIQRHVSASSSLEVKQACPLENCLSLGGFAKLFFFKPYKMRDTDRRRQLS
jgi:hypothetical protein